MKVFEVLFVSWACIGDLRVPVIGKEIRPIPPEIRPLAAAVKLSDSGPLCWARPEAERIPRREDAERRIAALGKAAAPRLRACEGWRCRDLAIEWKDRLVVDGREIK